MVSASCSVDVAEGKFDMLLYDIRTPATSSYPPVTCYSYIPWVLARHINKFA